MKSLLKYLEEYKKECVFAPLFKLLEASFELIVPLVVASLIDVGISGNDKAYIFKMCGALVGLAIVGFISAVTAQYFAAKAAVGFATKLRQSLFSHIQKLSFYELDQVGTSTLITRLTSDINQAQSGVNMVLRLFLRSPFIVFGAMVMAFTVNVKGAFVFAVTIPILSVIVFGVMLVSIPMFKKVQANLDIILGKTRENLDGARVIRAFNKQEEEICEYAAANENLTNMQLVVGRVSALMNPMTFIIINAATILVVWIGGKEVYFGSIAQGQVVALVNYMSQILVELVKLANLIILVTKAVACGNRIEEVFEIEASIDSNEDKELVDKKEDAFAIEFLGVSMKYSEDGDEALTDINVQIKKGQTIGVIGGTGSGKTSFVNLIPRFYEASKGSVKVFGVDVKEYPLVQLRDMVGVVLQKAVLFRGTIADNLRWGKNDATEEELWKAIEVAQATDIVNGKEDKLNYILEEGGKNLSGGQKQRLTIARAVVKNPDILILDDSASALDFATDAKLRKALNDMRGDKTIIIVSQRTSSIQNADQIIVLDDGEIAGIGVHDELLSNCEVYKEIYDSQFKRENKGGAQ